MRRRSLRYELCGLAVSALVVGCATRHAAPSAATAPSLSPQEQVAICVASIRRAEQLIPGGQPNGPILLADDFLDSEVLRRVVGSGVVAGICRTSGAGCANGVRGITVTLTQADVLGSDSVGLFVRMRPMYAYTDLVVPKAAYDFMWRYVLTRRLGAWVVVDTKPLGTP